MVKKRVQALNWIGSAASLNFFLNKAYSDPVL